MFTGIVGDVHGTLDELIELLDRLKQKNVTRFVSVGDILDKGEQPAACVRLLRKFSKKHDFTLVLGNHEHTHARYRRHIANQTGFERKMKNLVELKSTTDKLSSKDIVWLGKAQPYCQLSFPARDVLVVHGGIPPSFDRLPDFEELDTMSSKKRKFFDQMLRVRHVNAKGSMVMLGKETKDDPYWAEVYDGRFGHVYFGHQPYMQSVPEEFPHATGLDLGCVFGGNLCAAVLDDSGNLDEYVTVKSKAVYAEQKW